ncbi:MAG TPA: hypothetical protein VMP01_05390 [Pirellulaceae bacterium]|nr:hypothetical protein [Pirellulaceae bacterium]
MIEFFGFFPLIDAFLAGSLALSVLLAGKYALQLAQGKERTPWWIEAAFLLAAIVMLSVLTIDGMRWTGDDSFARLAPLPGMAFLLLALPVAWLHLRFAALRLGGDKLRRSPCAWAVLAVTLLAGGWSSYRFQAEIQPRAWHPPVLTARPLNMELETQFVGVSDRGREISLFRSATEPIAPQLAYHLVNLRDHPQSSGTVIARGVPDSSTNCHGWVFAGGEFLLDMDGIQTILADNGYTPCTAPQPGDVIVYFAGDEVPVHTGLVSGVLRDGTVIVESKWGVDGRYLHRPEDQPYSARFAFYRSDRGGNQITVRQSNTALAKHKQRLPVRRARKA